MQRREFIRFCAAGAAAGAAPVAAIVDAATDATPHFYARTQLIDSKGEPLRAGKVPAHRNLIFHYPYDTTPCFLLNLGRPVSAAARLRTADQRGYEWRGGVGAGRSVVAYSAICAHQLAYPTRDISFISYRTERGAVNRHGNVIHCCAEHSQYDPAQGARVVAGPAPQPLAAIILEHVAESDALYGSERSAAKCSTSSSRNTRCACSWSTEGQRARRWARPPWSPSSTRIAASK